MSDDRRILTALVMVVAAATTGDPILTGVAGAVTYVLARFFRPRRDTWDATAEHRRRMDAMRSHPARGRR